MTSPIPVQPMPTELTSQLGVSFIFHYIHYYLSSVHNCEDHFHILFFNRSAHIWFSYIYSHVIILIMDMRKYFFYTINFNNERWASKASTSLKQKLELGKVLKVEIREIRVMALSFFDFFVLLSNLRFKSQSLWLVISEISQLLSFFRSF